MTNGKRTDHTMDNLPSKTIPTGFAAYSPQQQQDHRVLIGVTIKAILRQFWQDVNSADAVEAVELSLWLDILQECSNPELFKAWATYSKDTKNRNANTGRLHKPDAGALYTLVQKARNDKLPKQPKAPPVSVVRKSEPTQESKDRVDAMAAEVGRSLRVPKTAQQKQNDKDQFTKARKVT